MKSNSVKIRTLDYLKWPDKCLYCGNKLQKGDIEEIELKVKKKPKALFVGSIIPRRLIVKYCGDCAEKISLYKTLETVGNLALIAAIIWVGVLNNREAPNIYYGGAVFWLGCLLMVISKIGIRKWNGVECKQIESDKWELNLRNDSCYNEFCRINSKVIYKF